MTKNTTERIDEILDNLATTNRKVLRYQLEALIIQAKIELLENK